MADVTRSHERAQMILVSGLTIAVTLLVLVLLLNTVIYAENVATRGVDSDVGDAAQFQNELDVEVAAILAAEHDAGGAEDRQTLEQNVSDDVTALLDQQARIAIERGHVAQANETLVHGVLAQQEASGSIDDISLTKVDHVTTMDVTLETNSLSADDAIEGFVVGVGADDVYVNRTDDGSVELWDGTDQLCEIDPVDEDIGMNFTTGSVGGGTHDCEDVLPDIEEGEGLDIDLSSHDEPTPEGTFTLMTAGEDMQLESGEGTWFVETIELDVTYLSAELRYETVHVVDGEFEP